MHQVTTSSHLRWNLGEVPAMAFRLALIRQKLILARRLALPPAPMARQLALPPVLVTPVVVVQGEFLPPGWWPFVNNGNGGKGGTSPTLDPTRFAFLQGLYPVVRIVSFKAFATRRDYSAFIMKVRSGRTVALVESQLTQNALYIFWADMQNWGDTATRTKADVLTGTYPEFICRICHQGDWQSRVIDLLAKL